MCGKGVGNFWKVWTIFKKFEIFIERSSGEKTYDCLSSRKFFQTLKFQRKNLRRLLCEKKTKLKLRHGHFDPCVGQNEVIKN